MASDFAGPRDGDAARLVHPGYEQARKEGFREVCPQMAHSPRYQTRVWSSSAYRKLLRSKDLEIECGLNSKSNPGQTIRNYVAGRSAPKAQSGIFEHLAKAFFGNPPTSGVDPFDEWRRDFRNAWEQALESFSSTHNKTLPKHPRVSRGNDEENAGSASSVEQSSSSTTGAKIINVDLTSMYGVVQALTEPTPSEWATASYYEVATAALRAGEVRVPLPPGSGGGPERLVRPILTELCTLSSGWANWRQGVSRSDRAKR